MDRFETIEEPVESSGFALSPTGGSSPLRCLWVTGDVIRDPSTGLSVYSSGLASAFANVNGVDLLAVGIGSDPGAPAMTGDWRSIRWQAVPGAYSSSALSLLHPLPHMAFVVRTREYRRVLRDLFRDQAWDVVLIDHLRAGGLLDLIPRRSTGGRPLIVHVGHNFETRVRGELVGSERSLFKRPVLRYEALKIRRLERKVTSEADLITAITADDASSYRSLAPGKTVIELTPGYTGHRVAERTIGPEIPRHVALLGNLLWGVKRDNLIDFLRSADDLFHGAGIEAHVIGPVEDPFRAKLENDFRSVTVLGRVDDVSAELAKTRIGIVSQPRGGGFKLRILDYVFNRVPMAILAGSAAGSVLSPGEDFIEERTEGELAERVVEVIDDFDRLNGYQCRAFNKAAAEYDWKDRGDDLYNAIADVLKSDG